MSTDITQFAASTAPEFKYSGKHSITIAGVGSDSTAVLERASKIAQEHNLGESARALAAPAATAIAAGLAAAAIINPIAGAAVGAGALFYHMTGGSKNGQGR